MFIQRLSIIGVGLIGGSLARALKRANACGKVIGCGRNTNNLKQAIELGVIDHYETNPARAIKDADMVVVAVPVGTMANLFASIRDALSPQAIITDVGSVKASVVTDAQQHLEPHFSRFVPAHPIAGGEKTGVVASFAELFNNHRVILTPLSETDSQAIALVTTMWETTGAQVINMSVEQHDEILAATSHLPHILAYNLVNTLAKMDAKKDIFQYTAGGFRDTTRIAASDPNMWRDICLANRDAILKMLEHFNTEYMQFYEAIKNGDGKRIETQLKHAKTVRDSMT